MTEKLKPKRLLLILAGYTLFANTLGRTEIPRAASNIDSIHTHCSNHTFSLAASLIGNLNDDDRNVHLDVYKDYPIRVHIGKM